MTLYRTRRSGVGGSGGRFLSASVIVRRFFHPRILCHLPPVVQNDLERERQRIANLELQLQREKSEKMEAHEQMAEEQRRMKAEHEQLQKDLQV